MAATETTVRTTPGIITTKTTTTFVDSNETGYGYITIMKKLR
jgi:hypothetical protein